MAAYNPWKSMVGSSCFNVNQDTLRQKMLAFHQNEATKKNQRILREEFNEMKSKCEQEMIQHTEHLNKALTLIEHQSQQLSELRNNNGNAAVVTNNVNNTNEDSDDRNDFNSTLEPTSGRKVTFENERNKSKNNAENNDTSGSEDSGDDLPVEEYGNENMMKGRKMSFAARSRDDVDGSGVVSKKSKRHHRNIIIKPQPRSKHKKHTPTASNEDSYESISEDEFEEYTSGSSDNYSSDDSGGDEYYTEDIHIPSRRSRKPILSKKHRKSGRKLVKYY